MDWIFGGRSVQMLMLLLLLIWGVNATYAAHILNVRKFGAVSGGKTDSSQAFLRAWEKACNLGGGFKILVPNGVFLVKPLVFQGPCKGFMAMQIKGILRAPKYLSYFHDDDWIKIEHIDGLFIGGGGVFDGQGAVAWPHNKCPKRKDCKLLPASFKLAHVTNATIQGITSLDSKSFHMIIFESRNIRVDDVKIKAPETSPNTDGIHIEGSSNVNVTRSVIGTGDDCISVGPGNKKVSILDVFCGPGHGISVGSLGKYPGEDDVFGLRVRNCTLAGTMNGVRVKTWQASPRSSASDFVFEDIVMRDVYNPIIIDQKYCPYSSCDEKFPSMVKLSNIKFRNIRGTSTSKVAVKLLCSKAVPCEDVELRDINLKYIKKGVPALASCSNVVHGSSKGLVIPPPCI
ncbi:exopolygalacturonase-like [Typha latifolia]|uniref:exopolygalacturonase-like n=1 Tax=Typha latifolia TaxID=4733 RepID=UPI003C2ECC53